MKSKKLKGAADKKLKEKLIRVQNRFWKDKMAAGKITNTADENMRAAEGQKRSLG